MNPSLSRARARVAVAAIIVVIGASVPSTPAHAAYAGANGPIVYTRSGEIWRLDPGSTTPVNLTQTFDVEEDNPFVSPDGTRVAFQAPPLENRGTANDNPTVWVMGIDGSNPVDITLPFADEIISATHPTWSPDGTTLAFDVYNFNTFDDHLYLAAADGTGGGPITLGGYSPNDAAWSPSGNDIAVTVGTELWIIDAASGAERVLVDQTNSSSNEDPDWSPDGSRMVYTCDLIYICRVNADGSGFEQLTAVDVGVTGYTPAYSPDGAQIVFEGQDEQGNIQIYTMPAGGQVAGGQATQLTTGAAPARVPNWGVAAGAAPPPPPDPGPDPGPQPPADGAAEVFDGDPATTERVDTADPTAAANGIAAARFAPRTAAGFAQGGDDRLALHVVLSRDDNFPDSLAGSALTGEGPLLFTNTAGLTPSTRAQIEQLLPPGGRVYLLGGTGAISAAVEQELRDAGYDVRRLAGDSRVETALAVADEVKRLYASDQVLLARADGAPGNPTSGWADSVSGGGIAAWSGVPVVVTPSTALHPAVAQWLSANGIAETYLLGGTAALSTEVESAVPGPFRVAGAERTETAALIARQLWGVDATQPRAFVTINGQHLEGWAFGLAAAGLSSDFDAPILMVTDQVSAPTADLVSSCGSPVVEMTLIGDESVIGAGVQSALDQLDGGSC